VITSWAQITLQSQVEPTRLSRVHALRSVQNVGQFQSQVSPGSMTKFRHDGSQSESLLALHPKSQGQRPSPLVQLITRRFSHSTLHSESDQYLFSCAW
jgi:hypothetical protein